MMTWFNDYTAAMYWDNLNLDVAACITIPLTPLWVYDEMFNIIYNSSVNPASYNNPSSGNSTTQANFFQLFVKQIKLQLMFVNQAASCAELDFWILYPRRDMPFDTDESKAALSGSTNKNLTWDVTGASGNNVDETNPLYQGMFKVNDMMAKNGSFMGGPTTLPPYYITPYFSQDITRHYKIKFAGHHMLKPGARVPFPWTKTLNKIVTRANFGLMKNTLSGAAIGKYTFDSRVDAYWSNLRKHPLLFVRARGCIVHDTTQSNLGTVVGGTDTNLGIKTASGQIIGHGKFDVGIKHHIRSKFYSVPVQQPHKIYFSTNVGPTQTYNGIAWNPGLISSAAAAAVDPMEVQPVEQNVDV